MAFLYPFVNFMQPGILWPWLAAMKPMLVLSIVAVLVAAAQKGGGMRQQLAYLRHTTFISMLLYVLVQIISVHYSGLASMIAEFELWYVFALQMAISLLLLPNLPALRAYVWGFMLGGSVVIGYGLWTFFTRPDALSGRTVGAYGMYENHNDYTFMAISLLPYSWMLLRSESRFIAKALLLALTLGCMAGVVVSLSRGGILVLAIELAWLVVVTTRGGRRVLILTAFMLCAPVVIVHQFIARDAGRTSDYTVTEAQSSRFELWTAAGNMIRAHPFLGVGSHRFQEFSRDYGEISHDNRGKVTHNTFLEIAAGSGLAGLTAFMVMVWAALAPLVRASGRQAPVDDALRNIRTATVIATSCFLIRANLDAKIFDPVIYTLLTLAIVCVRIQTPRQQTANVTEPVILTPVRAASRVYPAARVSKPS
jgi:O-antigen ligase